MKNIIHHLRNKSEHTKRDILHVLTVVFAIILVTLWIYGLGTNLASPSTQTKMNQDLQPFSTLKDNLVGGYKNILQPNNL
jgi:hypothetical protein